MEPLFRGTLGPIALERLGRIQAARARLDAEAGEVLGTVAEAQGHPAEPGKVRYLFDLGERAYAAYPAGGAEPPQLVVPPAGEQERSA